MRGALVMLALAACGESSSSETSFTTPLRDVESYENDACLIDADGRIFCWGDGVIFPNRQVYSGPENDCVPPFTGPGGVFSTCYAATPLLVDVPADDYVDLSSTCALSSAGELRCWPYTTPGCSASPSCRTSAVASAGLTLKSAGVFKEGWCGVTTDGEAFCSFKAHSPTSPEYSWLAPIAVPGGHVFSTISARANTYAALDPDGHAWVGTMGAGSDGELAPFAPTAFASDQSFTDIQVANSDNAVINAPSPTTVCGLTSGGGVICSGLNDLGQRGTGAVDPLGTPIQPPSLVQDLPPVVELAVGMYHACARTDGGDVYCWGRSNEGELGYTSSLECEPLPVVSAYCSPTPMKADLPPVRRMTAGANTTCVETIAGELRCLGAKLGGNTTQ